MSRNLTEDDYIDFLVSIQPLCKGREVIRGEGKIDGMHIYDAHTSICSRIKGFRFGVIEDGWVAFIWDNEVYTYPCTVSETLLTDIHMQSRLN